MTSFDVEIRRRDAPEKTTGRAIYAADVMLPGMLHAKVLRSSRAHARIVSIDVEEARMVPGVRAVVTGATIPAPVAPYYGTFIKDQSILAIDRVRYEGDMIAAVAAETEAAAITALALIRVTYGELPVIATIEDALADNAADLFPDAPRFVTPKYGDNVAGTVRPRKNVCFEWTYDLGDPAVFDRCDYVFEDEFRFSRMQHFHLEPYVSVATYKDDAIEITSATQSPVLAAQGFGDDVQGARTSRACARAVRRRRIRREEQLPHRGRRRAARDAERVPGALLLQPRRRLLHQHPARRDLAFENRRHARRNARRARQPYPARRPARIRISARW